MPKLEVRRLEDSPIGELALYCDGELLPAQASLDIHQTPNELTRVVVEFYSGRTPTDVALKID